MAEEFETLYQLVFFSTALALVLLERVRAWQRHPLRIARRWASNIGLLLTGSVLNALVIPLGIYAFALQQPPGLLSRLGLPDAAQLLLTFLLLDLWRYWEHRIFHRVPLLWRLHLVHHSDTQIDVTTAERHHPLDLLLGSAVMMALIAALGLPAPALGLYLLSATAVALFSHANLRLPDALDRALSWLVVTPAVHAVHHSDRQAQTDSNYGSVLTLWDRLFATYVDPESARIPHFGLDYFHLPRDTGFGRVLLQPFLFRRDLAYPERDGDSQDTGSTASGTAQAPAIALNPSWKAALQGGMIGCLLTSLVMWPTLLELSKVWRHDEAYQYAWLVVPMVAYLLGWHHRSANLALRPQPDFSGVLVVMVAAACWGAADLMNIDVGRQFAFILTLQGVALSTLGWRAYWRLFPTLGLLFLMIPSGDLLQPALRALTVKAIELFAVLADLPHRVEGFVIFIGTHRYIVVDECSGLAYVTLAIFLGYSFGLLLYRSAIKVAALALFGALLGIFSNALRVNAIVLIDWVRGSQMDLGAHGDIQWIALFVTLGLLFYVLSKLKADAAPPLEAPSSAMPEQSDPKRRLAPVVAGLSGLLIAGSATGLPSKEVRPLRGEQAELFPQTLSEWNLATPAAPWSIDPKGRVESISLTYRRGEREMHVEIVETLSPSAKLPESRVAPGDRKIWREKQTRSEYVCAATNCMALWHATWQREKSQELRHVYHAYGIGSFSTDSKFALRAVHGWNRLSGGHDHPRLIKLVFEDATPDNAELAAAFQTLQAAIDP